MAAARYFRFVKDTSAAPVVQTITGAGMRPKAVLIWSSRQASTGPADGVQMLFGMTDGVDQGCRFIRHTDGVTAGASAQSERTNRLVYMTAAAASGTPTVQVEGRFVQFTSEGLQIEWLTNDSDPTVFHVIAMGGDDLEVDYVPVKITVNSGGTVTGTTSFEPDCFITIGGAADEFGLGDYNLGNPYGSIHGFGFSNVTTNVCGWTLGLGGATNNEAYRGQHTDRCVSVRLANLAGATDLCGASITAKSATGFTMTRVAGSTSHQPIQHVLAIKGLRFDLGSFNTPAAAGDHDLALDFQPTLLLLQTAGTSAAVDTGMSLAVGAWSSGGSGGSWIGGSYNANPGVYASDYYTGAVLKHRQPAATGADSTVDIEATVGEVTSAGAVLNFSTVPASAAQVIYIAFAPTTSAFPVAYEDPCSITEPRLFAKLNTGSEVVKVGVHALRDSSAMGGYAEPRLLEVSPITRVASDPRTGAWSAQTATMRWADTDRANRSRSNTRTSFRNCDTEIYLTSNAQRRSEGPPRVLLAGKAYADSADENLVHSTVINDPIGVFYSLTNDEKQIPQRQITVNWFQNCPIAQRGKGEAIVGGRRLPLDPSAGEGVHVCTYVGQVTIGSAAGIPTQLTLDDLVAAMQASYDISPTQFYQDWGPRIGFGDCLRMIQDYGYVPSDYDVLIGIFGKDDIDRELQNGAATGGTTFEAVIVASHAIAEILDGSNGNPSIWIDDDQVDPAEFGTSIWCPQVPGYESHWSSQFGSDLFTDITGADGTVRRYTLILFDPASAYGLAVAGGATVHVDCLGLETEGDGTGEAIEDYFDLYEYLLRNFILGDYQSGAWLPTPQFLFSDGITYLDRINQASFAKASEVRTLQLPSGQKGSFTLADRTSVRNVVQKLNFNGGCLLAQDDYQRIGVKVLDVRRAYFLQNAAGVTHRTLRDKRDFLPGFRVDPKPEWQVNLLRYQYARNHFSNEYERGADGAAVPTFVEDTTSQSRDGVIEKTVQFDFISDDLTADFIANYYLDLFADMPHVATYKRRGLCGLEDDVVDGVPITHYAGFGASGYQARAFWVLSKTFDPKTNHTTFTALDVDPRLTAEETIEPDPLMLDPVALEALYHDVTGEALYADTRGVET